MKLTTPGLIITAAMVSLLGAAAPGLPGAGSEREGLGPAPAAGRLVGYFIEWGIYGRSYFARNVKSSGSAERVTHINYAFARISPDLKCELPDPWADYQRPFPAAESVDGVDETWSDTELRGNLNQLRKLREEFPQLKLMISIGGYSFSNRFSDAALTAQSRRALAESCIDMFIRGNVAPGISSPGLFDGIDIDWEYPGACGATCDFRPEDTKNFTALLAEFRRQLNAVGRQDHRPYLLTIAAPAGEWLFSKIQLGKIHRHLDFINLLSYDYHGGWETATNFHSPLYASALDPSPDAPKLNADFTVRSFRAAGVPAQKIVLGVPFYGRGWSGVPDPGHGLFQAGSGLPPGTFEAGVEDFKVLEELAETYGTFRDPSSRGYWIYDPSTGIFWGYDDTWVARAKAKYVQRHGLGGVMFWEFSGDDADGSLVKALHGTLH